MNTTKFQLTYVTFITDLCYIYYRPSYEVENTLLNLAELLRTQSKTSIVKP